MTCFEIDLTVGDAALFDDQFWRFVQARLSAEIDPDVSMDAIHLGSVERRVVSFGQGEHADAFRQHWRSVSSSDHLPPGSSQAADFAG